MPSLGIVILAGLTVVVSLVLVQIYLSWRPSLVWGLFLPAVFFLLLVFFALAPAALTNGLVLTETGNNMFLALMEVGLLTTALILAFTRIGKERLLLRKEQERQQRLEAKRFRLAAEAACLDGEINSSHEVEPAQPPKKKQLRKLTATPESAIAPPDAGHINRIYLPEQAAPRAAASQVARAFEEFGRSVLRLGRVAGLAIKMVSLRAAAGVVQGVWNIRDAAVPTIAAIKRQAGIRRAGEKNKLNAKAGSVDDTETPGLMIEDETTTDDTNTNK
jgi:hypothetical protein